jgi:hypothetical protein
MNMKQSTLILFAIMFTMTGAVAQDIITTKTGEDILAKIVEVGHTEIKYKKFDNPEGPQFTILKSDVLMIRYENGTKDIFTEEPKSNTVVPPYSPSPNLNTPDNKLFYAGKVEKYRKMKGTGATLTVVGGILLVVGIATLVNATSSSYTNSYGSTQTSTSGNAGAGAVAYLLGVAGLGAGIPLWIVGAHQQRKYSKRLEGFTLRFNVNPQNKGVTVACRF